MDYKIFCICVKFRIDLIRDVGMRLKFINNYKKINCNLTNSFKITMETVLNIFLGDDFLARC
jgi:hypothetical protein